MIQFGMRVHDICPKGSVCEVLDEVQKLYKILQTCIKE